MQTTSYTIAARRSALAAYRDTGTEPACLRSDLRLARERRLAKARAKRNAKREPR